MNACAIDSKIDFSEYTKLGITKSDVYQHYLETGKIGSPEFIKYKKERIENLDFELKDEVEQPFLHSHTAKSVSQWLSKLNNALGVPFEIISKEEAVDLHNQKGQRYNNEPAFFHAGKAYFIEGTLTPENTVHEFMHPFVKTLMAENPELFNKLYTDLISTEEGKDLLNTVNAKYGDKKESIQEEVLVRALTKMALTVTPTPQFTNWVKNFLVAIKQMLRKLIGKSIEIHKLDVNTSLKELAEIISKGDVVKLDSAIYTDEQLFEYKRDYDAFVDAFNNIIGNSEKDEIQNIINNVYDVATSQINTLEKIPELSGIADLLLNEYDAGLLNDVRNTMMPYSTQQALLETVSRLHAEATEEAKQKLHQRLIALTNTLFTVQKVINAMHTALDEIKTYEEKEALAQLAYFNNFIKNWGDVLNLLESSRLQATGEGNQFKKFASELNDSFTNLTNKLKKAKTDIIADIMYESLVEPSTRAKERFDEIIEMRKNAPQWLRDQTYRDFYNMTESQYNEFHRLKRLGKTNDKNYIALHELWMGGSELTKDKVVSLLNSEGPDANWFNSFLESLSLNTDPAIFSVQDYIQKRIAEYEVLAKVKFESYIDKITPHIKKNGAKFQRRGALGEKFGFKDRVAKINADGTLEEYEEWTFLNEWQNYHADKKALQHKIQIAEERFIEEQSDVAEKELMDAKQEYQDWKNTYMHQEFVPEYYEPLRLFTKDATGIEAKTRRDDIYNKMKLVQDDEKLTPDEKSEMIDDLWREFDKLSSLHNYDGTKKTGLELEIAERIKEYNEARSKFSSFREIPGAFQDAYNDYLIYLKDSGITEFVTDSTGNTVPNEIYTEMVQNWIEKNTTVALKNSVANERKDLLERRKELLEKLVAKNKDIFDDTPLRTLINDIVRLVNDRNKNQPDGYRVSSAVREQVRDAHQKIEDMLDQLYNYKLGGLTRGEAKRLDELNEIDAGIGLTYEEDAERKTLLAKELNLVGGLDPDIISELQTIDNKLSKMSSTNPTVFFKNAMLDIFEGNTALIDKFKQYASNEGYTIDKLMEANGQLFVAFINQLGLTDVKKLSVELYDFVVENMYNKDVYSFDDSKYITKLALTDIWLHSSGNKVSDYKTKMLYDADGKKIGLIVDREGNYRYPSMAYQQRYVRDEFVTEKIVGKTVDNRGQWLPKEESTNKYRNADYYKLKEDDPDNFAFMEALKEEFLKMQEGAENSDKLYLSFPRTRKTRLENIRTGNIFQFKRRFNEYWYGTGDDLEAYGISSELKNQDLYNEFKHDVFEHGDSSMPVKGVARLRSVKDASTDILKTMPEYMASLLHKQGARQSASYARNVDSLIELNESSGKRNKKPAINMQARRHNLSNVMSGRENKVRKSALTELIERDIDGAFIKSDKLSGMRVEKAMGILNKSVGFKLFSANLPSGIKNYNQIKLAGITHAFSFNEFNPYDGMIGEAWALLAASEISKNIRSRGKKGFNEQLTMIFDPLGGRTLETMGDNLSRTLVGDMFDLKHLQNIRKWLEMQGSLQLFGAMMHNQKVKVTVNGKTKKIPYLRAFELVDGRIQTKQGVDSEYALTYDSEGKPVLGKKLIARRLEMQQTIMKINGAFAKKDSGLIDRLVLAKFFTFLRKHLIPIGSKHYSFKVGQKAWQIQKRMNYTTGKKEMGHFASSLRSLINFLRTTISGKLPYMTKEELSSVMYVMNYMIIGKFLMPLIMDLLAIYEGGDDDDDDESVKKFDFSAMKMRSGYWYPDSANYDDTFIIKDVYAFNMNGYLLNHGAFIMAQTQDEFNAMNILTYRGIKEGLGLLSPEAIALMIQSNQAANIAAYLSGEKEDEYSRSSGPYIFQQEGFENGKYYNTLFDMFGFNGKVIHPIKGLEDYQAFKKMN